jgi:hypothetical protein
MSCKSAWLSSARGQPLAEDSARAIKVCYTLPVINYYPPTMSAQGCAAQPLVVSNCYC